MYRNFKASCEGNRNKCREKKSILPNTFRLKISFTSHLCLFLSLISSTYSRQYTGLFLHPIKFGDTQTHSVGLLLKRDRPSHRPLPDNTQHSQETDIHTPGATRTRNPRKRPAEDPRFWHDGRCCRLYHSSSLQKKLLYLLHWLYSFWTSSHIVECFEDSE
jgi:hypothetical protein